eukprot:gene48209-59045_t
MRLIFNTREVQIPEKVTVAVKARDVTVTGPKGKLERSFKHLAVDISVAADG